jgi:hypothetical protein
MSRIDAGTGEHPPAAGVLHERGCLNQVARSKGASCEQRTAVGIDVSPREGAEYRTWRGQQCQSIRGTCELGPVDGASIGVTRAATRSSGQ